MEQLLVQLQADLDALKAQVQVPAPDPAWEAVKTALEANVWSAPQAQEPAPQPTEEGAQ
jgi:hypothetical protein